MRLYSLSGNDYFAAGMGGREDDLTLGVLSGCNTFFFRFLDPMIHAVSDDVHDGILYTVHDRLVYLGILSDDGEVYVFIQTLPHIPDDPVHFLENAGNGNHTEGHGDVLEIIGQLAELAGGFHKVIQIVPREKL